MNIADILDFIVLGVLIAVTISALLTLNTCKKREKELTLLVKQHKRILADLKNEHKKVTNNPKTTKKS